MSKIKVFPQLSKDFFNYGVGAVSVYPEYIYITIPFYSGRHFIISLSRSKWEWDNNTLSLKPAVAGGGCSIGKTEEHAHFVVKDGSLVETA